MFYSPQVGSPETNNNAAYDAGYASPSGSYASIHAAHSLPVYATAKWLVPERTFFAPRC